MILFHGTTLWRAERILASGPDPDFVEPGGTERAENFSLCLPFGPFECTGTPEEYAWGKARAAAREGRAEGEPALLVVDVPAEVVALALDELLTLENGFVQFDEGPSLQALLASWADWPRRVIPFTEPTP